MKKQSYPLLSIVIIFLVAYLPLSSFLFALKNDMFIGYLPPKYLMGEAISNHQLPLWNPYISFGLPFYGDMSSGYWNPITWIIASTTGYNPYTLTCEVMLYIFLSGAGMYSLSGLYTNNKYIRLIAAVSFMCNGFIVGQLQHINWLSGAAFLPWSLWSIKKMYTQPTLKSICKASLLFYLLASSSHPGIIIGSIYFFIPYVIYHLVNEYNAVSKIVAINNIKLNVNFLLALLLLSSGMIAGYLDIIPHFVRNEQIDTHLSITENTNLSSWISTLLPFSTTTNSIFFSGDIAFRNIYFGLLLFIFFVFALFITKTKEQRFFFITGLLFLLISLGQGFKLAAIKILPLIGFVRVNAEFRIFAIFSFILVAVITLDKFQHADTAVRKRLAYLVKGVSVFILLLSLGGLVMLIVTETNFVNNIGEYSQHQPVREYLKTAIKQFSVYDTFFIQGSIQLGLLFFMYRALKSRNFKILFYITAFDLILATLLNIPYTGVGKSSVADIARIQQKSPNGIPIPPLQPITANDTIPEHERILFGEWSFYNKQIGTTKLVNYPVKLKNYVLYFNKSNKDSSLSVSNLPYIFITDTADRQKINLTKSILPNEIKYFSTNKIVINNKCKKNQYIIFLQNYYPHWFYYQEKNIITPVSKAGINFIAIAGASLREGEVTIFFNPKKVKTGMLISCITLLLYISIITGTFFNKK